MIPDFKTYIGESVWSDIHKRSNGETVRKEDEYKYHKEVEKIKKMDFIHPKAVMHLGVDYEWAPCNLGSDSFDQPGLYLNSEEIVELNDYLKGSGYEIAGGQAFQMLTNRTWKLKRIDKWWSYEFVCDGNQFLYIPNFGCYSESDPNTLNHIRKIDYTYYGICWPKDGAGYVQMKNYTKSLSTNVYIESNQTEESDKFQVRLVKKIS